MQSAAIISALPSPSAPRLLQLPRRKSLGPPARSLWPAAAGPFSVTSLRIHGLHRHGSGSTWVCVPSVPLDLDETMRSRAKRDLAAKVSSVPDSTAGDGSPDKVDSAGEGSLLQTLLLGSLFGLWYIFNIYFNIYNKQAQDTERFSPDYKLAKAQQCAFLLATDCPIVQCCRLGNK